MASETIDALFGAPITVLVGHAGVGKTNTALGLALALADEGHEVTLADLDVVNPYFRSSDYPELLASAGIRLIAPVLARTTLDTPSLTGELDAAIAQTAGSPSRRLVIDVGGDDDGATTIGRWAEALDAAAATVLYVVSAYRSLTVEPQQAAAMLADIERHAHLAADAVLNASNLGDETTIEHVRHGRAFARQTAEYLGLPVRATVVPAAAIAGLADAGSSIGRTQGALMASRTVTEALTDAAPDYEPLVVMPRFVRTPWDS